MFWLNCTLTTRTVQMCVYGRGIFTIFATKETFVVSFNVYYEEQGIPSGVPFTLSGYFCLYMVAMEVLRKFTRHLRAAE